MTGVLFACLAGVFFGALNITVRRALAGSSDVAAGSAVTVVVAFGVLGSVAVVLGSSFALKDLWPFALLGAFVPGLSQLLVVQAVQAAGASRAGVLFGMAPLFSALIAVVAFEEPLRLPLVAGTLLVVAGGIGLAWERERPGDFRALGAFLAVTVAVAFGLRDNFARALSEDLGADALAQTTALMLGAAVVLLANLLRSPAAWRRLRVALPFFASSGVVTAFAHAFLFAALERARVTVVAPITGTGVLWTVVFAALFLGRSELVGRRLVVVAVLVVAGGALVGATR